MNIKPEDISEMLEFVQKQIDDKEAADRQAHQRIITPLIRTLNMLLSASPAAPEAAKPDNWQQYAQDGENAQQCIERHRKEQDALLTLLANARRPYSDNEEMKL
jgi:hypothetical protein